MTRRTKGRTPSPRRERPKLTVWHAVLANLCTSVLILIEAMVTFSAVFALFFAPRKTPWTMEDYALCVSALLWSLLSHASYLRSTMQIRWHPRRSHLMPIAFALPLTLWAALELWATLNAFLMLRFLGGVGLLLSLAVYEIQRLRLRAGAASHATRP